MYVTNCIDIHNVDSPVIPSNYGAIAGALTAVLGTAVIIIIIALVIVLYRRYSLHNLEHTFIISCLCLCCIYVFSKF